MVLLASYAKYPFSITYQLSLHLCVWMTNELDCRFGPGNPGLIPSNSGSLVRIDPGALACRRGTLKSLLVGSIRYRYIWYGVDPWWGEASCFSMQGDTFLV